MTWRPFRRRRNRQFALLVAAQVRSSIVSIEEARRILGDNPWGLRRSRWHRLRVSLSSLIAP